MQKNNKFGQRLAVIVISVIWSVSASGQTARWVYSSTVPPDFDNPLNWSTGTVPDASNHVEFGTFIPSPLTVNFNPLSSITTISLRVTGSGDPVILDLNDSMWELTDTGRDSTSILVARDSSLTILNGTLMTFGETRLGATDTSSDVLTVGSGGNLVGAENFWDDIVVGERGTGNFNVVDGGYVNSGNLFAGETVGGNGAVLVSGTGSTLELDNLFLGSRFGAEYGFGHAEVLAGGSLSGSVWIEPTSSLRVNGVGSSFNGSIDISSSIIGNGYLEVSGGASAAFSSFTSNGDVLITGAGTAITATGSVSNARNISILDGADFDVVTGNFGLSGSGIVDGVNTRLATNGLILQQGTGNDLVISNNAVVEAEYATLGGGSLDRGGVLDIQSGGQLNVTDGVIIGNDGSNPGSFSGESGLITVNATASMSAGTSIFIDRDGVLAMNGGQVTTPTVEVAWGLLTGGGATTDISGDVLNSAGRVAPGADIGALNIDGDYQQLNTAFLDIELGGIQQVLEYDLFNISGTATLDGVLAIALSDSFNPLLGDSFTILNAQSISGEFSFLNFSNATLDEGLLWQHEYLLDPAGIDSLRIYVAAVPIPAAFLYPSALILLAGVARWRRRMQ